MSMTTPRNREKLYFCTCQSVCTKISSATGTQDQGKWVNEWTKTRHQAADRIESMKRDAGKPVPKSQGMNPEAPSSPRDCGVTGIVREIQWLEELPVVSLTRPLSFLHPPATMDPSDSARLKLNYGAHSNSTFNFVENRLQFLTGLLSLEPPGEDRDDAMSMVEDIAQRLQDVKEAEWIKQRPSASQDHSVVYNNELNFTKRGPSGRPARAVAALMLVLQHMHHATRRALRVYLAGVRGILKSNNASPDVLESIPQDPRTCAASFHIDDNFNQYLACRACHCLYSLDIASPDELPTCVHRQTPSSEQCGEPLWKETFLVDGGKKRTPIRTYYHHDIRAWLGRLLSRPGIEDLLDSPTVNIPPAEAPVDDIWSSKAFRNLYDANGEPFFPTRNGVCRLVFGLAVDAFIPYGSKSQTSSSTGIWLVLYNLPPHMRHLPQYLFLAGVIPGPDKPSKDAINHYIQLLVNDFLVLWQPGVHFTRTYKFFHGRLVEAIIIPVICDHPGLRQLIGYTSSSNAHYVCTACDIDLDDIHITDRELWPQKDPEQIKRFGAMWKDAATEEHQEAVFNAFGWRWSPLFALPYWDPVKYSVIDSMHAIDLNLFKNHIKELFQIDLGRKGGDRLSATRSSVKKKLRPLDDPDVELCRNILYENNDTMLYQLTELDRPVLHTVCTAYQVVGSHRPVVGNKWVLARTLHTWRLHLGNAAVLLSAPGSQSGAVTAAEVDDAMDEDTSDESQDDDDMPDHIEHGITSLNGSQKERKATIGILSKLVGPHDSPEHCDRLRATALAVARRDLYEQLAALLRLDERVLHGTKRSIHDNICSAIDVEPGVRELISQVIDQAEDDLAALTDAETDTSDRELSQIRATPSKPVSKSPLGELNGKHWRKYTTVIKNLLESGTPEYQANCQKKAFRGGSVLLFQQICGFLQLPFSRHTKKKDLHEMITAAVNANEDMRVLLASCIPGKIKDAVLGEDIMRQIWADMENTTLPSWISPPPANWGTAKRGTLSANNLRVIGTIHIPVSLTWIWRYESGRKQEILSNFMDLVSAARIACLRVVSSTHIHLYNKLMKRYVDNIQILYPGEPLKPSHHTALHIGDMMDNFGPDHSHNALFYERDIRILSQLNTNKKHGQMEGTFVRSAAQYANVCAVLEDNKQAWMDMEEMMTTIDHIKKEDLRGFWLASALDPTRPDFEFVQNMKPVSLDGDIRSQLSHLEQLRAIPSFTESFFELPAVGFGGVRYAASTSVNFRDSAVIFCQAEDPETYSAGLIRLIFRPDTPDRQLVFLVVDEYEPFIGFDPYRSFGFAAGYLCNGFPSRTRVIAINQLASHFVLTHLKDTDCIHVLPFDRTMFAYDPSEDEGSTR